MKLTIVLLIAAVMQVSATTFAQKLNLKQNDVTLKQVFKAIKKQTGYNIFYQPDKLKANKTINADFNNTSLDDVMKVCLQGQPLIYTLYEKTIVIKERNLTISKPTITAVEIMTITGKITDSTGTPLPGATIKIKGSNQSTSSNNDGLFSLNNVEENVVLQISFVGFVSQEVKVTSQSAITIILKEQASNLNAVVVVGYGTQKKLDLTSSIATISGKDIQDLPVTNLTNALAGRLPGLIATNGNGQPGSGSSIQIRGNSTLNDNTTLVVVDGTVRTDGFDNINPEDVANVTILKDASATAVYGARAGNGVILITTKRGNTGKPTITYSGSYGIQNPINYPKLFNAYEYSTLFNQALINQGKNPNDPTQSSQFFTQDQIAAYKNNIGTTDWYKTVFRKNSPQVLQTLSLSGGSEAIKYYISAGYTSQDGMFSSVSYKQYSFRSNLDAKINKNFKLSFNLEGRKTEYNAPFTPVSTIYQDVVYQRPTTLAYYPGGVLAGNNIGENPLGDINSSGYNNYSPKAFTGTITLEHQLPFITPGLSIKGSASAYSLDEFTKAFSTPITVYDQGVDGVLTPRTIAATTSLNEIYQQTANYTVNLSLNYARTFNKKHQFSALLLAEQYQSTGNNFNANKQQFTTTLQDELFASGDLNQTATGTSFINDFRRSLVGRVNYAFEGKYLLEATARYDGSYRFAPGHQYGFFPAISAGWRISEEKFFKNTSALRFIDDLKFRISNGLVGNDRVGAFQFENAYTINTSMGPVFNNAAVPQAYYGVYPNPEITWERQNSTNLGFDADLFKSALNITFDYFFRTTSDILYPQDRSIPATFGRVLPAENYAEMKGHGFEFSVGHTGKVGNVGYKLNINGSYTTNKVTKIDDPSNALDYQKQLGRIYGFIPGYQALGYFQTNQEAQNWYGGTQFGVKTQAGEIKYADVNGDGQITSSDQKILSNNNYIPRIMFGLSGSANWNGFNFDFLFQGAADKTIQITGNGQYWAASRNAAAYLTDSWTPSNPNAKFPLIWNGTNTVNDRTSSVWLKDAAYVRLKSSSLGYTFKTQTLKHLGIQSLNINLSGTNLLTFSKFKEFDPEAESGSLNYYPQQRVLALGLKLVL